MSLSHTSQAEEKHIPIPIVDNEDLNNLIIAIDNNVSKAGPGESDNQEKIRSLIQTLKFLSAEAPSVERSVKIHTAVMQTYLLDGFVDQRKKIKKGEPSIRTALGAGITEFQENTQSRLFLGHVSIHTRKEDLIETQIMHSICSQREARELTEGCYQRTIAALIAGAVDEKKMAEAQRIYQNAKRVVIEIEDKFKTSSNLWNDKLEKDRIGLQQTLTLTVPVNNVVENREKHSVEAVFNRNKKEVVNALYTSFYPAILLTLLTQPPKDAKKPLSAKDNEMLNELIIQIGNIQKKYKPVRGNEIAIQSEIYKALMPLYVFAYTHQTGKDGTKLTKGALLSHLEDALKIFHDKTKNDMFYGAGDKLHDKILNSFASKKDDHAQFRIVKQSLEQEMARYAFDVAISEGLKSDSSKSRDHFIFGYKAAEKMGKFAKIELNKHATQALSSMAPAKVIDPKSQTNEMKKQAKNEEEANKKFSNYLIIRDNVEVKEADLQNLYDVARHSERLKSALQTYKAPVREEKMETTQRDNLKERKSEVAPAAPTMREPSAFNTQPSSPRLGIFSKPASPTSSPTRSTGNSRNASTDLPPSATASAVSSRRPSTTETKPSIPDAPPLVSNRRPSVEGQSIPKAPDFSANQLDASGKPKPIVEAGSSNKASVSTTPPKKSLPKEPMTFERMIGNLSQKVRTHTPSISSSKSDDDWDDVSTPKAGKKR